MQVSLHAGSECTAAVPVRTAQRRVGPPSHRVSNVPRQAFCGVYAVVRSSLFCGSGFEHAVSVPVSKVRCCAGPPPHKVQRALRSSRRDDAISNRHTLAGSERTASIPVGMMQCHSGPRRVTMGSMHAESVPVGIVQCHTGSPYRWFQACCRTFLLEWCDATQAHPTGSKSAASIPIMTTR